MACFGSAEGYRHLRESQWAGGFVPSPHISNTAVKCGLDRVCRLAWRQMQHVPPLANAFMRYTCNVCEGLEKGCLCFTCFAVTHQVHRAFTPRDNDIGEASYAAMFVSSANRPMPSRSPVFRSHTSPPPKPMFDFE